MGPSATPQTCALARNPELAQRVAQSMPQQWSPQQIAGWRGPDAAAPHRDRGLLHPHQMAKTSGQVLVGGRDRRVAKTQRSH